MSHQITEKSQPRLKVGINATSLTAKAFKTSRAKNLAGVAGLEIYVGDKSRGVILESTYSPTFLLKILTYLNGKISLTEISERSGAPISLLKSISQQLLKSGLLDLIPPRLILSHRFEDKREIAALDGSVIAITERLLPELEIATWRTGALDSGISVMQKRTEFPILIFGKSRIE